MEEIANNHKNLKRDIASVFIGLQFTIVFMIYMATPGYVTPYLYNSTGRMVLFYLLTWQSLGLALYMFLPITKDRKVLFAAQTLTFVILFLAPLILTLSVGPIVTQPRMAM